jgi:hypothetical protein
MFWDWRLERKWSVVGFCSGAVAGLVAITPGSGYVGAPASVLFGFMAGTVCNFATQLKFLASYDDALDVSGDFFPIPQLRICGGLVLTSFPSCKRFLRRTLSVASLATSSPASLPSRPSLLSTEPLSVADGLTITTNNLLTKQPTRSLG